jgi:hypothetical protein
MERGITIVCHWLSPPSWPTHQIPGYAEFRIESTWLFLESVSKGRFEKSEPMIHHGEDLDVPTYIRRGVALK